MDRDVTLILIGAGIALASSIITLILQFYLGQLSERIKVKREEKNQRTRSIREELLRKDVISIRLLTEREKKIIKVITYVLIVVIASSITGGFTYVLNVIGFLIPK